MTDESVPPAPPVRPAPPIAPSWTSAPPPLTPAPPPPAPPVAPSWTSPTRPLAPGAVPPPAAFPPPSYPPPTSPAYGAQNGAQYGTQYGALPGVAGWGAVPQAPKPGVIPLRPLSVGEILDGAISYIRRDPRTVLGISAGVALVLAVIQFVGLLLLSRSLDSLATDNATSDQALTAVAQLFGTAIVQGLAAFILNVLAVGLLTNVMGQAILGHRVTLAQAWARTAPRFWAMIGLTLLVSLIVGAVAFVGVLLAALVGWAIGSVTTGGVGATIGIVAGIATLLASVWVYIRLLLAPVALILENVGVTTALRRSWILVRAGWWRTFGIYLLGAVIAGIVGQILSVPFSVVGGLFTLVGADPNSVSLPFGYLLATALGVLVSTMVVLPFTSGVVALLYVDRRIRREALDIELARAAAA